MSNSLAELAAYPGLVGAQQQIGLGQALMSSGAQGPSTQSSQSALSPATSLVQGILGSLLSGQGQQQLGTYQTQQNQALAAALQQQSAILTGDGSSGMPTSSRGGLQGASPGTLSTNSGSNNTSPSPAPQSPMTAATPNGAGGFHIPGASPYALAVMHGESGGNVTATNPNSTATGAAQFTAPTWQSFVSANPSLFQGMSSSDTLAARTDPTMAAAATDWLAGQNAQSFKEGGIDPTGPNLALAHRLGAPGAAAVIRAQPGTPVAVALGTGLPGADVQNDIKANPQLGSMTVDQLRGQFAGVPDYQVASANTGTATDAMPSSSAPPRDTNAMVGGMNRAGNAPIANPQLTAQLLSSGSGASPVAPPQQSMSKALQLYQLGQQDEISPNPRLQAVGQSQIELARTLLQRGQFQPITLPNGVQAQRNITTGETTALPQRSVTTADGTVYDANTGQPIAGGVGAGGVRNQDVQGAAINTMAQIAPRIQAGVASPQERAAYASAASAFQGAPQTYQRADGTTGTYVRSLPQGFPDPNASPPGANAAGGSSSMPGAPAAAGGMPGSSVLPGPTNAAAALPKQQAQDTGSALVSTIPSLRAAGQTGQRVVDQVGQIKQAMASATASGLPQGYFSPELGEAAAAAKYLNLNIPGLQPGAVPNQQIAEATLKQFGGEVLKTMFPSRITNADIQLFLPSMGDLSHDPQAVSKILDNATAYASYDVNKSQSMERQLSVNGGQLPPTWEANYNLVHGSGAHLAPIPSQQQSAQLGWGQSVPAEVSNLNGFGSAPQRGAPSVGTVATNPQSGEQQVMTKLGWRSYQPGQGVSD